jgi:peptidoglycan/xylan/chitin deacetylase (PgdA/CDA1 family)
LEITNQILKLESMTLASRTLAWYNLAGTANVGELVDEVELSARKLAQLTGKKNRFYRSGTAYYDEVAVQVIAALGYQAVSYSVLGDAGATFNRDQVKQALLSAKPGTIVICHMNHPESETAEGVMAAVPELRKRGIRFVRLGECMVK